MTDLKPNHWLDAAAKRLGEASRRGEVPIDTTQISDTNQMTDQKSNTVSDTPKTNANILERFKGMPTVAADFARTLERELAAMTKERDDYHRKACDIADQRDTLRARVAELEKQNPQRIDISSLVTLTTLKEPQ